MSKGENKKERCGTLWSVPVYCQDLPPSDLKIHKGSWVQTWSALKKLQGQFQGLRLSSTLQPEIQSAVLYFRFQPSLGVHGPRGPRSPCLAPLAIVLAVLALAQHSDRWADRWHAHGHSLESTGGFPHNAPIISQSIENVMVICGLV